MESQGGGDGMRSTAPPGKEDLGLVVIRVRCAPCRAALDSLREGDSKGPR